MKWRTLAELDDSEGTVQLVDDGAHRSGAKHAGGESDIVLIPQPSSDINDPLRWPTWKKYAVLVNICFFCMFGNANIGMLSPGLEGIAIQFKLTPKEAASLVNFPILTIGIANFFWTPLGIYIGKRPVFLMCASLLFGSLVWGSFASSYTSLLASIVVGSWGVGAADALGSSIVNDLFFTHERANKMSVYLIFLSLGASVGPLLGGIIIGAHGWIWTKRVLAILTGINLVTIFLFAPETRYFRHTVVPTPESMSEEMELGTPSGSGSRYDDESKAGAAVMMNEVVRTETAATQVTGTRRTYLQSLSPYSNYNKEEGPALLDIFIRPFALIIYPANFFSIVCYGFALGWIIIVATVISFTLAEPPYLFGTSAIGLANVPTIIGNIFGAVITGYPSDAYVKWRARRSHGVFEPESRLVFLVIPGILVTIGLLMYGFGTGDLLAWPIIYIGSGLVAVGLSSLASITMLYSIESYFPVASESLLVINGCKNILAFGMSYDATTWIATSGPKAAFGEMAAMTFLWIFIGGGIFMIWGKKIRHYTSSKLRLICW